MTETPQSAYLRWLALAAVVVVIIGLVVVALVRQPVELDPASPEGTVQSYLQAISEERWEDAYAALDPEEFGHCDPFDISSSMPSQPFSATLGSTRGNDSEMSEGTPPPGGAARVSVRLRFGSEGPFGSSWETTEVFRLKELGGVWRITGEPWPYFSWACEARR